MTLRLNSTDFWRWAYSDFLSNALRGVLAEYIVAQAAGCTHRARTEWDAYDLYGFRLNPADFWIQSD
ncbi:hypothetical protein DVJ83_00840 [Deinococcus wulumuqiensis]|uniref:Uncharacterized protein n=1 Tax=Deinococcus wulumuqiensis TaxID=980427 RepID=A0A345IE32_9DEIO|nr:hypothetical protein DVJ83_00840 [Deinococcus wulumuqiensis]